MFKLRVFKYLSDQSASETASSRHALVDHLEASAARHGFEVTWNEPGQDGELWRDGRAVGGWWIEELEKNN